jgi:hypothetical protein
MEILDRRRVRMLSWVQTLMAAVNDHRRERRRKRRFSMAARRKFGSDEPAARSLAAAVAPSIEGHPEPETAREGRRE